MLMQQVFRQGRRAAQHRCCAATPWRDVKAIPSDPILGLVQRYKEDPNPKAVNLAQGAYRDDAGRPFVLEAVVEAERRVLNDLASGKLNKEYLGIEGDAAFRAATAALVFGEDSASLREGRVTTLQSISGTGALRLAAESLKMLAGVKSIWMSSPSYGNHPRIFESVGFDVNYYRFLDKSGVAIDWAGLIEDFTDKVPRGSAVLLHACAHNPTGVDPTQEQWKQLAALFKDRGLVPLFDSAYQGYASGCPDVDAFAIREFDRLGLQSLVCTSYAKSMGLYGERIGCLSLVCGSSSEAAAVMSVVKQQVIRPMYSSPPLHGARVATLLLTDPELNRLWRRDLLAMSKRIDEMRRALRASLERHGAPGSWSHVTDQIGMFAFTGLRPEHVQSLLEKHGIYLTSDGRLSLAGLKAADVDTVASGIAKVLSE